MTEEESSPKEEKTIPFFPDHITTEAKVVVIIMVLMIIVGIAGLISPIGLGSPADPMVTPHVKSDWYFLFLYQMLKYVPKTIGVLIPIIGLMLIVIWPFLDRKGDTLRARNVRWIIVVVGSIVVIGLTIMGALS